MIHETYVFTDAKICFGLCTEALLQRIQFLRGEETATRSSALEAQTVDTTASKIELGPWT